MKNAIKILLIIALYSCTCRPNKDVEKDYLKKIENISNYLNLDSNVALDYKYVVSMYYSEKFLKILTGIEGHIVINEPPGYKSPSIWIQDSLKWVNWFEENGCAISKEKYYQLKDSIMVKYNYED